MAKKIAKKPKPKKIAVNDVIDCPYCGCKGTLASMRGKAMFITHRIAPGVVLSKATGLPIQCEVFYDGCLNGKKIGRDHEVK